MKPATLGAVLHSFFEDHLKSIKGLRPSSVRSYRDALRLFLHYVSRDTGRRISRLSVPDLSFDQVRGFLEHLEQERGNARQSRNQRLAILHTFFDYLAARDPQSLAVAERVAAIPAKRTSPPETHFLEREQIEALFKELPAEGWASLRDRALLLFLYNTGARVQEVAEVCRGNIEFGPHPRVRLHGKGDKWRTCPLWRQTADCLQQLLEEQGSHAVPEAPAFVSRRGLALTRFGIYKIVRRRTQHLHLKQSGADRPRRVSPHVFRHTTAVHLLEAGVEVNVIRGWLGHVSLDTTNRYAEINIRAKEEALRACEIPTDAEAFPRRAVWRDDQSLLKWLASL